jgi:hypothetical protein
MQRTATAGLYEKDFALWIGQQVDALRQAAIEGRLGDVDIENIIEELEGLAKSDRRELFSRLVVLIVHLLKLQLQPKSASGSWMSSVLEQSRQIRELLNDSPSLKRHMGSFIERASRDACREAAAEMNMPLDALSPKDVDPSLVRRAIAGEDFGGQTVVDEAKRVQSPRGKRSLPRAKESRSPSS